MVKLAVPGYVMVISEFLAFEILTLASAHLSTTALAAQSVLATLSVITFQIPFPISIAASTRLANLIGAGLPDASWLCIRVTLTMACCAGAFNLTMLTTLRNYIPRIFTSDPAVTDLVVHVVPLFAAFQLFDALVASCSGILRGMGRQTIGGWVNVICYYGVSLSEDCLFDTCTYSFTGRDTCLIWDSFRPRLGLIWVVDGSSCRTLLVSVESPPLISVGFLVLSPEVPWCPHADWATEYARSNGGSSPNRTGRKSSKLPLSEIARIQAE